MSSLVSQDRLAIPERVHHVVQLMKASLSLRDTAVLTQSITAGCDVLNSASIAEVQKEWVLTAGAFETVIRAMRTFTDHMDLQYSCSLALRGMSLYHKRAQEFAGDLGAVELVVEAMKRWPLVPKMQLGVVSSSFMEFSAQNRQRWANAGGFEQNMRSIQVHYGNGTTVLSGCASFSTGADTPNRKLFMRSGGVQLLLGVWRDHADVHHMREKISQTFLHLAKDGPEGQSHLVSKGYIGMLAQAMAGQTEDFRLGYFACETLSEMGPSALPFGESVTLAIRDLLAGWKAAMSPKVHRVKRGFKMVEGGDRTDVVLATRFPVNRSCPHVTQMLRKLLPGRKTNIPSQIGRIKTKLPKTAICPCSSVLRGECYGGSSCPDEVPATDTVIVVAHCRHPINFLNEMRRAITGHGLQLVKVIIVSKCGFEDVLLHDLEQNLRPLTQVVNDINRGRCDHSWASYIHANYDALPSRLIMVKDSWAMHAYAKKLEPVDLVRSTFSDFACAYRFVDLWHLAKQTKSFTMRMYNKTWDQAGHGQADTFTAPVRPLHKWMRAMGLPRSIERETFWPVCYGGGFVTTRNAVQRTSRRTWRNVMMSLARGDNIEESHYMERAWAAVLTRKLQAHEEAALTCATKFATTSQRQDSTLGAIGDCQCSHIDECRLLLPAAPGNRSITPRGVHRPHKKRRSFSVYGHRVES
jgi:hypothetical protein